MLGRGIAPLDDVSRYDLQLAAVPVAFLLALTVSALGPLSPRSAVPAAGGAALLAVVDALFVHPPQ